MTEEKKRYVLYEYLLYFWKKKKFFVIVPLITAALVASAVYFVKHDYNYTGQAVVFTGSIDAKYLTNPDNILASADELGIKNKLDVFVSEKGQVKFTMKGDSKSQVEAELKKVVKNYNKDLQDNYKKRLKASMVYLKSLEESVEKTEKLLDDYYQKLDSTNLSPAEYHDLTDLTIETEKQLADDKKTAHRMRSDLVFFEKPKILSENVEKSKTYIPEGIAVGVILGLVMTVALLMLLKYLGDARRHYDHD
ncbi:hypothetical protein C0971_16410 [Bacillus methanolicus]|uniref:hypothetical protein n=1 Tax=Bacillus methanolicus TaxID=1471 RepID=UPI00200CB862|nr:hypothetical protein [Bacillus methanolicus]UQD53426.1 hypothetical protein C0971_16410 [Bacillus methanolicus]